jgi:hypothetical protein
MGCCDESSSLQAQVSSATKGVYVSTLVWFLTSPVVFITAFRYLRNEADFPHKYMIVAVYSCLLFLAAVINFFLALCRSKRKQLFAVHATSLMTMQVPYCAYHLLSAAAIFRAEITATTYIVLSQADYFIVMLLSGLLLRREVVLNQIFAAVLGLAAIFIFLFIEFNTEGSAIGSCSSLGCFRRHRPSMDEWKGIWLVLGARVCFVLRGVLSKRLLLWQARQDLEVGTKKLAKKKPNQNAVAPSTAPTFDSEGASNDGAITETSQASAENGPRNRIPKGGVLSGIGLHHPGPGHLFFSHGTGGSDSGKALMDAMEDMGMLDNEDGHEQDVFEASKRFWLYLTRLDQVFDSMTFDAEYFGTTLAGTMDLHQMGGSIMLLPASIVAAYIDGEFKADSSTGTRSFWEDAKDMQITHTTSLLLIVMAVVHLLRPMSLSRVVMGHSEESYTALRMVAMVLCLIWGHMYMQDYAVTNEQVALLGPLLYLVQGSMPLMKVLSILLFCIASAWFVLASVAAKRTAVLRSSVQQIVRRFEDPTTTSTSRTAAPSSPSGAQGEAMLDSKRWAQSQDDRMDLERTRADLLEFVRSMDAVDKVLGRAATQRMLLDVALAAHTADVRAVRQRQRLILRSTGGPSANGGAGEDDEGTDEDEELLSGGGPQHVRIGHVLEHLPLLAAEPLVRARRVFPPEGGSVGALVRGERGSRAQVEVSRSLVRMDPSALAGLGREVEQAAEEEVLFEKQQEKMGFVGFVDSGELGGQEVTAKHEAGQKQAQLQFEHDRQLSAARLTGAGVAHTQGVNYASSGGGMNGGGMHGGAADPYGLDQGRMGGLDQGRLGTPMLAMPAASAMPMYTQSPAALPPPLPPFSTPNGMSGASTAYDQPASKATDSIRKPSPAVNGHGGGRVTLPPMSATHQPSAAAPISAATSSFYDAEQDTDDEDDGDHELF